jgi:hypothetical protein
MPSPYDLRARREEGTGGPQLCTTPRNLLTPLPRDFP